MALLHAPRGPSDHGCTAHSPRSHAMAPHIALPSSNRRKRKRKRERTDLALLENVPRHDTHLAPLRDDTGAVTANHARLALALERIHHPDLVPLGDTLGNSDNELDLLLDGLDDGVGSTCGGHVDDGSIGLGFADCVLDGAKDGEAEVFLSCFLVRSAENQ